MTIYDLRNYVNSCFPTSRATSANLDFGDNKLRYFIATSAMTTGKPPKDAFIIHMDWDTKGWPVQIAVGDKGELFTRGQSARSTWTDWKTFQQVDNVESTMTLASIINGNTANATITEAHHVTWGKVAQLYMAWKNVNAISVPANGNIANINIGTLVSGKRPKAYSAAHSNGDNAGAAWYSVASNGDINLGALEATGASRTIAANTTFTLFMTYILP